MLSRIDHIGVAVEDLDAALELYADLLEMPVVHRETVHEQGVEAVLLDVGENHVELLAPLGPDTPVGKFLAKKGPGLHHVAYRVGTRHSLRRGAAGKAIGLRGDSPGWIGTTGELQSGAYGIAAPVRGVPGLRASVGVVTFEPLEADVVGPQVIAAAAAVAGALR